MNNVLILGGYGNFGKRIAAALVAKGISVVIAGRNQTKAYTLASNLGNKASIAIFDVHKSLAQQLQSIQPKVVINTCGPFQKSNYDVAQTCINHHIHYIDLADGRDFVVGIADLNDAAKNAGVAVISGASTVPGLSSTVLEQYKDQFSEIHSLTYGISPGQKAERGLATTAGILTYIGKPLKPAQNSNKIRYGWQNIYRQHYPELGNRWMANCDIPDLDLLPKHYGIKDIQFSAGMESSLLHFGIWLMSWLVRIGLPIDLSTYAKPLLYISHMFNGLGTEDGGMHIVIKGMGKHGKPYEIKWFIIAKDGDGPHIPTIPAIILAEKLICETLHYKGACACVGMVSLSDYLKELEEYHINTYP